MPFITTPASHHVSHCVFICRCVWHRYQYCLNDTEFNFTSLLFWFFVPLSVNVKEWIKEASMLKERGRESEGEASAPASILHTSVLQRISKWNQRLVSQTALEGSHCDCESDWDLINSLHRLCKVHICLFRSRLLRINQLSNRKGNSVCGVPRRTAYKRRRHYCKCLLLNNAHFITCVLNDLTANYIISRVFINSTMDTRLWILSGFGDIRMIR